MFRLHLGCNQTGQGWGGARAAQNGVHAPPRACGWRLAEAMAATSLSAIRSPSEQTTPKGFGPGRGLAIVRKATLGHLQVQTAQMAAVRRLPSVQPKGPV